MTLFLFRLWLHETKSQTCELLKSQVFFDLLNDSPKLKPLGTYNEPACSCLDVGHMKPNLKHVSNRSSQHGKSNLHAAHILCEVFVTECTFVSERYL